MNAPPVWLLEETVLAIHRRQLAEHGGGEGLRDKGLLESALARPLNLYAYGAPDVAGLAAAYAYGIARNHPFVDGNKRVSLILLLTFLSLNGANLPAPAGEIYQAMMKLAAGDITEQDLADWVRVRLYPLTIDKG
jgi:death-on-curing protein